jgi:hypothetical protein
VLAISLGTVKSRITRGRDALRKKLAAYVQDVGPELGLLSPAESGTDQRSGANHRSAGQGSRGGRELEVTP